MNSPTYIHLGLVKRIIKFLLGTIKYGLNFTSGSGLSGYSDSDWAADVSTRRSITRYVIYIGDNPISWQSKKQSSVSRSSTKVEYKSLAHDAVDIAWIRLILRDLCIVLPNPPLLLCDNQYALAISLNHVQHSKIKHLEADFHFVGKIVHK